MMTNGGSDPLRPFLRLNLRPNPRHGRPAWLAISVALVLSACGGAASPAPTTTGSAPASSANTGSSAAPVASGPPIAVIGTENFYADLLTQIGGSRVTAASLLNDPNADPHAFESSPQDAALVADAKLVIVNGLGYDSFMDKLLGASSRPDRVVVNVQQVLGVADDVNVHVWYDPATMPMVAAAATDALSTIEPQNAAYFAAQEQAYLATLKPIGDKIAALKAAYAGKPIAFTEDVAGYLTARIGLDIKSPLGFMKAVEEGTDPPPADVAVELDLFTTRAVKVLLYNSQVTTPITVRIHDMAQQDGVPIVGVAETIPPAYHTYAEWQLGQLDALGQALAAGG
jgi:zinc/manganese transport system substrate-binding protein